MTTTHQHVCTTGSRCTLSLGKRLLVYALCELIVFNPLVALAADPVAANNATTVYKAANGITVVDIARANAAGLSHNKYTSYDVDKSGLVLNNGNASELVRQSQLAGQVTANLNLVNEAKVILNEVVNPNRSKLEGYTEVLGGSADVIVANPYGITCNGCGFINTPNVTLTSGQPVININDGSLSGFEVGNGDILITGDGIDGSSTDYLSLVARSVFVDGLVNARDLSVSTGNQQWNYATRDGVATTTGAALSYGFDSTVLGGMYANRIRIQATEAGVGVRMLGEAAATGDDFTLEADGQIVLKNKLSATQDITISSSSAANNALTLDDASISAKRNLSLAATGGIQLNGGLLAADNTLSISANTLTDTATVTSLTDNNKRFALNSLMLNTVNATTLNGVTWGAGNVLTGNMGSFSVLNNSATVYSDGVLNLTTSGNMNLATGVFQSAGDMNLNAGGNISTIAASTQGIESTGGNINLTAANGLNNAGTITATAASVIARVNGTLNNSGTLHAKTTLDIADKNNGSTVNTTNTGMLLSDNHLVAQVANMTVGGSAVVRSNTMTINANALTVNNGGAISTTGDTTLNLGSLSFGGSASRIITATNGGNSNITLSSGFSNPGAIHSGGNLTFNLPSLNNTSTGGISALGTLSLNAYSGDLYNAGALYAGSQLNAAASGIFTNYAPNSGFVGSIDSSGSMSLSANTFINNSRINAAQNIIISANTFRNEMPGGISKSWGASSPITNTETSHIGKGYIYGCCDHYEEWYYQETWYSDQYYTFGAPLFTPQIIGGGAVTVKDFSTGTNVGSIISGNQVNLTGKTGSTFTNDSLPLYRENNVTTYMQQIRWAALGPAKYWDDVADGYRRNEVTDAPFNTLISKLDAGIYANTAINMGVTTPINTDSTIVENQSKSSSVTPLPTPTAPTVNFPGLNTSLPANPNGYFVPAQDPQSNYLIETNPLFSVGSTYLGSDYLAERLGYNPDTIQRRLGDAAYENFLVQQQLIEQTGRNVLIGYESEQQQIHSFLDAATNQSAVLGLVFGKALTAAQIAELQEDIIWMVEVEIAGETVLVPVVYLAQSSRNNIQRGAVIAAKDINMDVEGLTNNGGTISATNTMTVISQNDIHNTSGTISANDMALVSTDGKIINETTVTRLGNADNYQDMAGPTGTISANNNLILSGNQGVDITGANVTAGESAVIHSENGDINIQSLALESKSTSETHSGDFFNQSSTQTTDTDQTKLAASVNVGSDADENAKLTLLAEKGNVNLVSADLNSTGDLNIKANDVNATVLDLTKSQSESSSSGNMFNNSSHSFEEQSSTASGSNLTVGGALNIIADNDIVLEGATVNATTGNFDAGNNFITRAAQNTYSSSESSSSSGFEVGNGSIGYGSRSESATTDATLYQNSQLNVADGVAINAKNTADIGGMDVNVANAAPEVQVKAPGKTVDAELTDSAEVTKTAPELQVKALAQTVDAESTMDSTEVADKDYAFGFDVNALRATAASGDASALSNVIASTASSGMGVSEKVADMEQPETGQLSINADEIVSTKYKNELLQTNESASTYVGIGTHADSSDTSASAGITLSIEDKYKKESLGIKADNINTLAADNISLNGNNSIDIKGVDIVGGSSVNLTSEGDINIAAAEVEKTHTLDSHSTHVSIGVEASATTDVMPGESGPLPLTAAPVALSANLNVGHESQSLNEQSNGHIDSTLSSGGTLNIQSGNGDVKWTGVTASADTLNIDANNFTSDAYKDTATRTEASSAVGINLTASTDVHKMANDLFTGNGTSNTTLDRTESAEVGNTLVANTANINVKDNVTIVGGDFIASDLTIKANTVDVKAAKSTLEEHTTEVGTSLGAEVRASIGGDSVSASVDSMSTNEPVAKAAADSTQEEEQNESNSHNGKAMAGELVGAEMGLHINATETTTNSTSYSNANLQFNHLDINTTDTTGSGKGDGHVDIGGANLLALVPADSSAPRDTSITITTGEVKTTKYVDDTTTTVHDNSTFIGVTAEAHSAIADAYTREDALQDKANEGMTIDEGLHAAQAGADATNMLMGDALGGSAGLAFRNNDTRTNTHATSENINYLNADNISITATQGNIDLKGVEFNAPPVYNEKTDAVEKSSQPRPQNIALNAAQDVNITAAKSTYSETSTTLSNNVTVSAYGSASAMGSSVGVDAGYNGNTETNTLEQTSYSNAQVDADNITIKAQNLSLTGANVNGGSVKVDIENNINVTSVQDTQTQTTTRANWGGSVGASVGTYGITPSVNGQGGGGDSHDNYAITQQQSGIQAENNLNVKAGGDLKLTGAHIGVNEGGSGVVNVDGNVTVNKLDDMHEKDGLFAGGGFGFDAGGVNANVDIEKVDQIHNDTTQNSTISGVALHVGGTISGDNLTSDGKLQTEQSTVNRDENIAGVQIVASGFAPVPKGKKAGNSGGGSAPISMPSAIPPIPHHGATVSDTAHIPSGESATSSSDQTTHKPIESVVVVVPADKTGGAQDKVAQDAAEALVNKNTDKGRNVVLVKETSDGGMEVIKGDLSQVTGNTKVEVVSHGDQLKDRADSVANIIKQVDDQTPDSNISRVNVDACTNCNKQGEKSFGEALTASLKTKKMVPVEVAEYSPGTKVHITEDGTKQVKNDGGDVTSIVRKTDDGSQKDALLAKAEFEDTFALDRNRGDFESAGIAMRFPGGKDFVTKDGQREVRSSEDLKTIYKNDDMMRSKYKGYATERDITEQRVTSGIPISGERSDIPRAGWSEGHIEIARALTNKLRTESGKTHNKAENSHALGHGDYGVDHLLSAPSASKHQNTEQLGVEVAMRMAAEDLPPDSVRLKITDAIDPVSGALAVRRMKVMRRIDESKAWDEPGNVKIAVDHLMDGERKGITKEETLELSKAVYDALVDKTPENVVDTYDSKKSPAKRGLNREHAPLDAPTVDELAQHADNTLAALQFNKKQGQELDRDNISFPLTGPAYTDLTLKDTDRILKTFSNNTAIKPEDAAIAMIASTNGLSLEHVKTFYKTKSLPASDVDRLVREIDISVKSLNNAMAAVIRTYGSMDNFINIRDHGERRDQKTAKNEYATLIQILNDLNQSEGTLDSYGLEADSKEVLSPDAEVWRDKMIGR